MEILNKVKDEILGDLMCFANEELEPICWGKYVRCKLFFREEIVSIKFDLYFYDVNFNIPYLDENEDRLIDEKKKMWKVYQEFLLHEDRAEDILFEEFSEGFFLEEEGFEQEEVDKYREKYKTKEELFKEVTILEVRIFINGYHVIISVPWKEGKIAIADWHVFEKEKRKGYLIPEEESCQVEMEYPEEDLEEDINY